MRSLLYRLSYPVVVIRESNPAACAATIDDHCIRCFLRRGMDDANGRARASPTGGEGLTLQ